MSTGTTNPMTSGGRRRRSIFSGLLLILLGVLLLLHNLRSYFPDLWGLFARWWPVLLIVWGLAKLYDHLMAQRTGQLPPRTITGGDIFLVILVIAIVGSIGGMDWVRRHGDSVDVRLPWEQTYSFSEEVPAKAIPADSRISIRIGRGDITVHPEDTAEIRVAVKKIASGTAEEEAQKRANQVRIEITEKSGSYEVRPQGQGEHVAVDLEVHVPKQASVTAWTGRGGVQINGLQGSVTAHGEHGDIEIRNAGGDVSAELSRGDVHIVGTGGNVKLSGRGSRVEVADVRGQAVVEGEFFGPIRIEKVAKGVRFVSRRTDLTVTQLAGRIETGGGKLEISDAPGNVSLTTREYDIVLENVRGRVHIQNRGGNVKLHFPQPPREEVEVSNASGDIELTMPAKSSFEVHAETRSGQIECDFQELASLEKEEHRTARLDGVLGAKGPQLRLKSSYGTIRLHKSQ